MKKRKVRDAGMGACNVRLQRDPRALMRRHHHGLRSRAAAKECGQGREPLDMAGDLLEPWKGDRIARGCALRLSREESLCRPCRGLGTKAISSGAYAPGHTLSPFGLKTSAWWSLKGPRTWLSKSPLKCSLWPLLLALGASLLTACTPKISVNLGLGAPEGPLVQQTVLEDKGKVEGTIAMIDVRGLIADARVPDLILGPGANPVDNLVARLKLAEDDTAVKAIILRINSPGGTVTGSDIMYREVRRFSERTGKPVIASLGEVAASGGYYLACAADTIIAQPTTITASIGVIIPTYNFSEGLDRIGIHARNVTSGPNKDIADPFSPMRDRHYEVLQGIVEEFYSRFKGLVLARRPNLRQDLVADLTDGRVVTGARAVEVGLADKEGGLREAFEEAKVRAGLKGARMIKFVDAYSTTRSPYAAFDAPRPAASAGTEINLLQIKISGSINGASSGLSGIYYLWLPTP